MDIRVVDGDRLYGAYKTLQYKIDVEINKEGYVETHFGHGYGSTYPYEFMPEEGSQQGGSVTLDPDAAEWLGHALLNLSSEYDKRKRFTLKFDAEEME